MTDAAPLNPAAPARRLRVRHETRYDYEESVELAHHVAFLCPRETPWQQVGAWRLSIAPLPNGWVGAGLFAEQDAFTRQQLSRDPFGNTRLVFSHAQVHDYLQVGSGFEATLQDRPAPQADLGPHWREVAESLRYHAGAVRTEAVEFTLGSPFAPTSAALAEFARQAFDGSCSVAGGAVALMTQIHTEFKYEPLSTHVGTRAPEALAQRRGVCQDFAHVMIAACRSIGLAARYVSGYLLTHPRAGQPRLIGADASHAWVEVWCPQQGWLALDPTNKVFANQDHVTLAWGRDYADVAPLRGVIRGSGATKLTVAVTVEPVENARA
ncbi:MAG: transglutaminase family protein [Burkholderiaceae bacterium]|nr:transglutaminase family protein [Burkholderiaceae bacterium]